MADSTRLYLDDPLLWEFDATVVRHGEHRGCAGVVLDRTAFYPESGGQAADHGRLDDAAVVDVQLDEQGAIVHVLDGPLPALGAHVHGAIDGERRRTHMALHTGQHILSQALLRVADARTVSSRLGETACTIDVRDGVLGEAEIARAQELANRIIDDDVPIRAYVPEPDELARLPLRRRPKVADQVRVVRIGDYDVTPCGGTHCLHSAQVGLVRITGVERYKGGQRVTFAAGPRARRHLFDESDTLQQLARRFSCSPADVPLAVDKLQRELAQTGQRLERAHGQLAEQTAAALLRERADDGRVVATLDGASVELLRAIGTRLARVAGTTALLAGTDEQALSVVLTRAEGSTLHCGQFLARAAKACGGRGGGRADHAEGRLPAAVDWAALVAEVTAAIDDGA